MSVAAVDGVCGAGAIQPLQRTDVHRICSGQVVLSLATAVKELVENSIDAGATHIEVRVKDHGSELVEVVDDGQGVQPENFPGLTLKHHTSKLRDFSDLDDVDTFGFRGEALSSLCALSDVTIITRHASSAVGTKLVYDHDGHITQQTTQARQVGTTVCVSQLFSTLPVRHKEFLRSLKKEFGKMVQILNAYCLIATGVKITCTNQVGTGKKVLLLSTNGNKEFKDNIINLFGVKQFQPLLEIQQLPPDEDACTSLGITPSPQVNDPPFSFQGYVSSSEHKLGRSSADRQFYFINKRPCDPNKISRLVNEVYHQYNRHQYPFIMLHITLHKGSVDVNVTPDKRQVFVQYEKLLLAAIKTSLNRLFERQASVYQMNQTLLSFDQTTCTAAGTSSSPVSEVSSPLSSSNMTQVTAGSSALSRLKRDFTSAFHKDVIESVTPSQPKQRKLDKFVSKKSPLKNSISCGYDPAPESSSATFVFKKGSNVDEESRSSGQETNSCDIILLDNDIKDDTKISRRVGCDQGSNAVSKTQSFSSNTTSKNSHCSPIDASYSTLTSLDDEENGLSLRDQSLPTNSWRDESDTQDPHSEMKPCSRTSVVVTDLAPVSGGRRREKTTQFNLTWLKHRHQGAARRNEAVVGSRAFLAQINPSDNQAAEDELKKNISKESFKNMEILGQFNLGFIITRLGDDLFIVDQHASDEKYNFEKLQAETQIQSQKLIIPQSLPLTVACQTVLQDNLHVFHKNGFEFIITEDEESTDRVRLTACPVSKTWQFGQSDIEELIFMLGDSPGLMCRPSRIRQMFASRACRKSIMIGTALNSQQMKRVVCHMAEIEQPWNCPHGRPTMRHLINLRLVSRSHQT